MNDRGVIRIWHEDDGWGVLDSARTPGGCWVHFSALAPSTFWVPQPADDVEFEFEGIPQDGYDFRATRVWPLGSDPAVPELPFRFEVDGEVFDVQEQPGFPGTYHYAWISGPNANYGFTSGSSDQSRRTHTQLIEEARDFLAMIDPETGYISGDEDDDRRDPSKPPLGWPPR